MADEVIREVHGYSAPAGPRAGEPAGSRLGQRFNLEKVSWGAIWAGVMVTIGMEALFLSFGIFIGGAIGGSTIWTMAWYLVTMAVSFFTGAWSAARLSDVSVRGISVLHGVTTWGLATLASGLIAGVVGWAALRLGVTILASTPGTVTVNSAALWGGAELYAGIIWGGMILALGAAYLGGLMGLPSVPQVGAEVQQAPEAPRRAA